MDKFKDIFENKNIKINNLCVYFDDSNQKYDTKESNLINYNSDTTERYRVLRLRKMDPITYFELDENYAFKFKYVWDSYTGERKHIDSNGPLYFDPDILIKYFYTKRLNKLWYKPSDEYEGYYDDGVGAGSDFFVIGRGYHPEWYLFRLPILDCYLTDNHNNQHITFGPILTNEEICEIDMLANLRPDNYENLFCSKRPSLIYIKKIYDNAISKTPECDNINNINNIDNIPKDELNTYYNKINRQYVDLLINM